MAQSRVVGLGMALDTGCREGIGQEDIDQEDTAQAGTEGKGTELEQRIYRVPRLTCSIVSSKL